MNGIPVKMCCHSTETSPKFSADVGDTVLVKNSSGLFQELTIQGLVGEILRCQDIHGAVVEISPNQIKVVYIV